MMFTADDLHINQMLIGLTEALEYGKGLIGKAESVLDDFQKIIEHI